jgi:hypothetical protein
MALESELQRRGMNKQNATRIKKRIDALVAREAKGPLVNQVTAAKYEHNMRHFVGWEEPKVSSPLRPSRHQNPVRRYPAQVQGMESVPRPYRAVARFSNLVSFLVLAGRFRFRRIRFRLGGGA